MQTYDMVLCICNAEDEKKALLAFKESGARGATLLRGKGSAGGKLLCALGLDGTKKTIGFSFVPSSLSKDMMQTVKEKLHIERRGKGVVAAVPLRRARGLVDIKEAPPIACAIGGNESMAHELLLVVVERGQGDVVVEEAKKVGAQGATILHGRGSGAHTKEKFFALSIDPEKDVVLIIANEDIACAVSAQLDTALKLSEPNSGVLASVSLQSVMGLTNT